MEHLRRLGYGACTVLVMIVLVLSFVWLYDWATRKPPWVGRVLMFLLLTGIAYICGYQLLVP